MCLSSRCVRKEGLITCSHLLTVTRAAGSSEDHFSPIPDDRIQILPGTSNKSSHRVNSARRRSTASPKQPSTPTGKLTVKLVCGDEIHAIRAGFDLDLLDLKKQIRELYGKKMKLKYRDDEEELVTIKRPSDLSDLLVEINSTGSNRLRLYLFPEREEGSNSSDVPETGLAPVDPRARMSVFDAIPVPTVVADDSGIIRFANVAFAAEAGQPAVLGRPVETVMVDPETPGSFFFNNKRVLYLKSDGSVADADLSVSELTLDSVRFKVGTLLSPRLSESEMLQKQEREALSLLLEPAAMIDTTGSVIGWNSAATKMFGCV